MCFLIKCSCGYISVCVCVLYINMFINNNGASLLKVKIDTYLGILAWYIYLTLAATTFLCIY